MAKENRKRLGWDRTLSDIRDGNPRVAAILAGARVQSVLRQAILFNLVPLKSKEDDDLFDRSGPLATFSAQIKIGYALGLYGTKVRHDLDVIRDIRNEFAHHLDDVDLGHVDFAGRLGGLHAVQLDPERTGKNPGELLADAVFLLSMFLIMRTAPAGRGVDDEFLAQLRALDYSDVLPAKKRYVPTRSSAD